MNARIAKSRFLALSSPSLRHDGERWAKITLINQIGIEQGVTFQFDIKIEGKAGIGTFKLSAKLVERARPEVMSVLGKARAMNLVCGT